MNNVAINFLALKTGRKRKKKRKYCFRLLRNYGRYLRKNNSKNSDKKILTVYLKLIQSTVNEIKIAKLKSLNIRFGI